MYSQASHNSSPTCSQSILASGLSEISCFGTRLRWGCGFWHRAFSLLVYKSHRSLRGFLLKKSHTSRRFTVQSRSANALRLRDIEKNTRHHRSIGHPQCPSGTGAKSEPEGATRSGADRNSLEAQRRPAHGPWHLQAEERRVPFQPGNGRSRGEILVDATTGESGNAARDKRMQDEVLESNRYPGIFFHPTANQRRRSRLEEGTQELMAEGHLQHPRGGSSPGIAAKGANCRRR